MSWVYRPDHPQANPNGMVPRELVVEPVASRSDMPFPMLISDTMDPAEHPADGQLYSSKSRFRQVTKANGLIEVGNDPQRFRIPTKPKLDDAGLDRAIDLAIARTSA